MPATGRLCTRTPGRYRRPWLRNPLWAFSQGLQGKDSNAPSSVEAGVEVNEQLYVACMQARGYSYTIERKE